MSYLQTASVHGYMVMMTHFKLNQIKLHQSTIGTTSSGSSRANHIDETDIPEKLLRVSRQGDIYIEAHRVLQAFLFSYALSEYQLSIHVNQSFN